MVMLPGILLACVIVLVTAMTVRRQGWGVLVWLAPMLLLAAVVLWVVFGGPLPDIVLNVGDVVVAVFAVAVSVFVVRRKGSRMLVWLIVPLILTASALWDVFGGPPSKARYMIGAGISLMAVVQMLIMWKTGALSR